MPFLSLRSVLPATILAGVLLVAATGCTSASTSTGPATSPAAAPTSEPAVAPSDAPAGAASTKAEACTLLASSLSTLSGKMSSASTVIQKDPPTGLTQLEAATSEFASAVATITEPGAHAVATKANDDLTKLVASTKALVADPSKGTAGLESQLTTIQTDFGKIGSYCQ